MVRKLLLVFGVCIFSHAALALEWNNEVIDTLDASYISITADASGNPHLSYYVFLGTSDTRLKHAWFDGTWHTETVDSSTTALYKTGMESEIKIDAAGHPHIVYRSDGFAQDILKYASHDGSGWTVVSLDSANRAPVTDMSMAFDAGGSVHIVYRVNYELYYGTYTGGTWTGAEILDGIGYKGAPSLVLGDSDVPRIITANRDSMMVATGPSWTVTKVMDLAATSPYHVMAGIDGQDYLHLLYPAYDPDLTEWVIRCARQTATGWEIDTVESSVNGLGDENMALAVTADGTEHVFYTGLSTAHYAVKGLTGWSKTELDSVEYGGGDIAVDGSGNVHIGLRGSLAYIKGTGGQHIHDGIIAEDGSMVSLPGLMSVADLQKACRENGLAVFTLEGTAVAPASVIPQVYLVGSADGVQLQRIVVVE